MATESIQNHDRDVRFEISERSELWSHAAGLHGVELRADQLAAVDSLTDLEASLRFLPDLSDPERDELLWAVAPQHCLAR